MSVVSLRSIIRPDVSPRTQASDLKSTTTLATTVLRLSYEAHDLPQVNGNLALLSKKHGQFKAVIQAMVEQSMGWMDEVRSKDGLEKWLELVETLRQVTEGKVSWLSDLQLGSCFEP